MVRISELYRRSHGMPRSSPPAVAAAAGVLGLLAGLAALTQADELPSRSDRAVDRAAELLRLHPERGWRIPALAAAVELSPAYLTRRFRQRFGHTLARFQLIQRIGAAQALLACTTEPVAEVGRRVGLPDPHHFNKLFRRVVGRPPSVFRAAHRS